MDKFYDHYLEPVDGGFRCNLDGKVFLARVQVGRAIDPQLAIARRDAEAHVLRLLEEQRNREAQQ